MFTYCYMCDTCDNKKTLTVRTQATLCDCGNQMRRDYPQEWKTQSVHIPLHMSSRNTTNKSDFLPSTKDFESPTDPTGEKGMDNWKATHTLKSYKELI